MVGCADDGTAGEEVLCVMIAYGARVESRKYAQRLVEVALADVDVVHSLNVALEAFGEEASFEIPAETMFCFELRAALKEYEKARAKTGVLRSG